MGDIADLKAQDRKKMRTPHKLEPDTEDVLPCRPEFRHAPPGDPNQGLDPGANRRGRSWDWAGVLELTVVHTGRTRMVSVIIERVFCHSRLLAEKHDEEDDNYSIDCTNSVSPSPTT